MNFKFLFLAVLSLFFFACQKDALPFQHSNDAKKTFPVEIRSTDCIENYVSPSSGVPSPLFSALLYPGDTITVFVENVLNGQTGKYLYVADTSDYSFQCFGAPIRFEGDYNLYLRKNQSERGSISVKLLNNNFNQEKTFTIDTSKQFLQVTNKYAPFKGTNYFVARHSLAFWSNTSIKKDVSNGYAIVHYNWTYSNGQTDGMSKVIVAASAPVSFSYANYPVKAYPTYTNCTSFSVQLEFSGCTVNGFSTLGEGLNTGQTYFKNYGPVSSSPFNADTLYTGASNPYWFKL